MNKKNWINIFTYFVTLRRSELLKSINEFTAQNKEVTKEDWRQLLLKQRHKEFYQKIFKKMLPKEIKIEPNPCAIKNYFGEKGENTKYFKELIELGNICNQFKASKRKVRELFFWLGWNPNAEYNYRVVFSHYREDLNYKKPLFLSSYTTFKEVSKHIKMTKGLSLISLKYNTFGREAEITIELGAPAKLKEKK